MDKTFLDLMGKHNLEPVVFTFSFFTKKARSDPRNWVIAGFVTQLGKTANQKKFMEKGQTSAIFHQQMRVIMRDMNSHGWKATMQMRMCGIHSIQRLVLFLLVVIGDGQGSDLMCGRYISYNNQNGRIMWQCLCPPSATSEFQSAYTQTLEQYKDGRCKYIVSADMEKLVIDANDQSSPTQDASLASLGSLAQQKTYLWTFGNYVPTASPNGGGIFGSCHIDNLHAIKGGLFPKLSETILSRLTPKMMEAVDTFVYPQLFGFNKQSRIQEKFFRTTFRSLCEMSKMTSMEKAGHLFSWMIVTRSGIGATLFTMAKRGPNAAVEGDPGYFSPEDGESWLYFREDNQLQTFGRVFEMALSFDQFVSHPGPHLWDANAVEDEVSRSELECDNKIGAMMGCITWVFPKQLVLPVDENGNRRPDSNRTKKKGKKRKRGEVSTNNPQSIVAEPRVDEQDVGDMAQDGDPSGAEAMLEETLRISWNSQKFHSLRHVSRSITSLGPLLEFDSGPCERNHTHFAKIAGFTAIKRKNKHQFQTSTGTRVADRYAIEHANRKFGKEVTFDDGTEGDDLTSTNMGTKFCIKLGDGMRFGKPKVYKRPKHWNRKKENKFEAFDGLPQSVLKFVEEQFCLYATDEVGDVDLVCSTELRIVQGQSVVDVVRCHPDYPSVGRRFDWVNIRWGDLKHSVPHFQKQDYVHMGDEMVVPCQLACVVQGLGNSSYATLDPKVIVRVTVDQEQKTHCPPIRSVMLNRWTKLYERGGDGCPVFCCVTPEKVVEQVICFEDFPTDFGTHKDFYWTRDKFMKAWLKKEYSTTKFMKGSRYIYDDFVYSVRPKREWPNIFNYLCRNTEEEEDSFYVPPDPPFLSVTTVNSDTSDEED